MYKAGGRIEIGQGGSPLQFSSLSYDDDTPLNVEFMSMSTGEGIEGHWKVDSLMSKYLTSDILHTLRNP